MTAIIQAMHRHGIQVVTYGKAPGGYERLRHAPDLAGYAEGRFWGSYNSAGLGYLEVLRPPRPDEKGIAPESLAKMVVWIFARSSAERSGSTTWSLWASTISSTERWVGSRSSYTNVPRWRGSLHLEIW